MFDDLQRAIDTAGLNAPWIRQGDPITTQKGSYIIAIRLESGLDITLAQSRAHHLLAGTYCYAGSAFGPGGLKARVNRHLKSEKKIHWHVDRLTTKASFLSAKVFLKTTECDLIKKIIETNLFEIPIIGYGSTDCSTCKSHLLKLI